MPQRPNYFGQTIVASSAGLVDFGFEARAFRFSNDGAGSVYLRFGSTTSTQATTGDYQLTSGDAVGFSVMPAMQHVAYAIVSTGVQLRIMALGG